MCIRDSYGSLIQMICKKYTPYHSEDDTEDMVQQVWLNVWKSIEKIDMNSPFLKTFISRVGINCCISHNKLLRNAIYFKKENISMDALKQQSNEENDVSANFEERMGIITESDNDFFNQHILEVLKASKKEYTIIYEMKKAGYTAKEIGKVIGRKEKYVYHVSYQIGVKIRYHLEHLQSKTEPNKTRTL